MKKTIIIIVALVLSSLGAKAQEILNDTVIDGHRYAILNERNGTMKGAVPFDEHRSVIDLNQRLRKVATRQTAGAVLVGTGSLAAILGAYNESPGLVYVGSAIALVGGIFELASIGPLWTDRLYIGQDGITYRINGKKRNASPLFDPVEP